MPPYFNISTKKILKATDESYQPIDTKEDEEFKVDNFALKMVRELVLYERAYMLLQEDESQEMVERIQAEVQQAKLRSNTGQVPSHVQEISNSSAFAGSEEHLKDADACLKKLRQLWRELLDDASDDNKIKAALSLGGSKPVDFLQSIVVRINNPVWMKGRWWQWKQWTRVKVMTGGLPDGGNAPPVLKTILPRSENKKSWFSSLFGAFINTTHKVEYQAYWCGVRGMFAVRGHDPTRYLMILGELQHAEPEVFETVMAQAIVRYHWNLVFYWGFCFDRILDIIAIHYLYKVSGDMHVQKLPRWYPVYGLTILSALSSLKTFASFIQCYVMYKSLDLTRTFWNFIFLSIELLTFAVFWTLAQESYSPFHHGRDAMRYRTDEERISEFQTSFFARHPLVIPYLVAGRWAYLLLALLNLEVIGQSILPVWEAARSRQSLVFLAYLFLGTVACAHSYFTFPIEDVDDFVMAFFRTMRLTFLGDFDMFELQGLDDQIQIRNATGLMAAVHGDNSTIGVAVAGVDEDDQNPKYMKGIRGWALMWAFLGPVIFMNSYVGLLGSAYEQASTQIGALFAKFRISTLMMLLLRRHFFEENPCRTLVKLCKVLCGGDPPGYVKLAEGEKFEGYWISIPKKLTETQEDVKDISQKIDEASHESREEYGDLQSEIEELRQLVRSLCMTPHRDAKRAVYEGGKNTDVGGCPAVIPDVTYDTAEWENMLDPPKSFARENASAW